MVWYWFASFWLGDRSNALCPMAFRPTQAHNGYIEIYLNLGLVGLFFLVAGATLSSIRRIQRRWDNVSAGSWISRDIVNRDFGVLDERV